TPSSWSRLRPRPRSSVSKISAMPARSRLLPTPFLPMTTDTHDCKAVTSGFCANSTFRNERGRSICELSISRRSKVPEASKSLKLLVIGSPQSGQGYSSLFRCLSELSRPERETGPTCSQAHRAFRHRKAALNAVDCPPASVGIAYEDRRRAGHNQGAGADE